MHFHQKRSIFLQVLVRMALSEGGSLHAHTMSPKATKSQDVVARVLQDRAQVVLGESDKKVQALPPERAQESLTQGIGLGTPHGGFEDPQPQILHMLVKLAREDTIAVMDEKAIGMVSRNRCP
jgi:hypothetical protein